MIRPFYLFSGTKHYQSRYTDAPPSLVCFHDNNHIHYTGDSDLREPEKYQLGKSQAKRIREGEPLLNPVVTLTDAKGNDGWTSGLVA